MECLIHKTNPEISLPKNRPIKIAKKEECCRTMVDTGIDLQPAYIETDWLYRQLSALTSKIGLVYVKNSVAHSSQNTKFMKKRR